MQQYDLKNRNVFFSATHYFQSRIVLTFLSIEVKLVYYSQHMHLSHFIKINHLELILYGILIKA